MRKIIALVLLLIMCFSLTACASETDKALEQARALIDAEDYEGAEAVLDSIESYQAIVAMKNEIQEKDAGFLLGKWISLNGETSYEFDDEGNVSIISTQQDSPTKAVYSYKNNKIEIAGTKSPVVQNNGVYYIGEPDELTSFVKESDYTSMTEKIEITADNWEQYFELLPAMKIKKDEFGKITWIEQAYGLFLREPFEMRYLSGDMTAGFRFRSITNYISLDAEKGTYEIGEIEYINNEELADTSALSDFRNKHYYEYGETDFDNQVVCDIEKPYFGGLSGISMDAMDQVELTQIKGSITLKK